MSKPDAETPLVTHDRLDLSLIAPRPRQLVIECGTPREPREFRIRGRLDTDRMIEFLQLETQINEALADDDERKLIAALDDANRSIRELLLDLNTEVPEKLHLDESEILMLLAWLSGEASVADRIARALTGGESGAQTEEELAADRAGEAGGQSADADAPFSSSSSS